MTQGQQVYSPPMVSPIISLPSSSFQRRPPATYKAPPSVRPIDSDGRNQSGLGGKLYGRSAVERLYQQTEKTGPLGLKRRPARWLAKRDFAKQIPAEPGQATGMPGQNTANGSASLAGPASRPAPIDLDVEQIPGVPVKEALLGRREAHLLSGWEFFRAGQFREAVETFGMADAIVLGDPSERAEMLRDRAECRIAILYAAFAGGMYSQATGALTWLLQRDRVTNELPDPLFLTRIPDIRQKYGNPALFDAHLQVFTAQIPKEQAGAPAVVALRAFAFWNDRSNPRSRTDALFDAKNLADPRAPQQWQELYGAMLRADASVGSGPKATSRPTEVRLPWEVSSE